MTATYDLANAFERAAENPSKFQLPDQQLIRRLEPGDIVKLVFLISYTDQAGCQLTEGERMWVQVTESAYPQFRGTLDNDPYCTDEISAGLEVEFSDKHIIDVYQA